LGGSQSRHRSLEAKILKMPSSDLPTVAEQPRSQAPTSAAPAQTQGKGGTGKPVKLQESAVPAGEKKLTGAELKKKAKEEKAARRAAEKAAQGGAPPAGALLSPGPGSQQRSEAQKGVKVPPRRRGSAAAEVKNVPVRGGQQKVAPAPQEPKKEDKTVEFFRHLYKTRTTSIAGASKEVHPAVLALGLQMGNYTICGSCARLVATLQAFKRVSFIFANSR
jgi:translation initiation factor eIF-2B subunit delta